MADQSDVEAALAGLVASILYPNGATGPSSIGVLARVFRGWPNQASLNTDLAAGRVIVSVFSEPGQSRITTRHLDPFVCATGGSCNLSLDVAANVVTVSGQADPGQLAGLLIDNTAFVHRTEVGDTPELVAAVLGSYINSQRIALVDGTSITVPGAHAIVGRVMADQLVQNETRRQQQGFRISLWCPTPRLRDSLASLIDVAFSTQTFISLPDSCSARLRMTGTAVFDQSQNAGLYRRDLLLTAEYPTTITTTVPSFLFGKTAVAPNGVIAQSLLG